MAKQIAICSSTYGTDPDVAVLMDDGSVKVYNGATKVWSTLPPLEEEKKDDSPSE